MGILLINSREYQGLWGDMQVFEVLNFIVSGVWCRHHQRSHSNNPQVVTTGDCLIPKFSNEWRKGENPDVLALAKRAGIGCWRGRWMITSSGRSWVCGNPRANLWRWTKAIHSSKSNLAEERAWFRWKRLAKRTKPIVHSRKNVRENVFREIVYAGIHPICRAWSNTPDRSERATRKHEIWTITMSGIWLCYQEEKIEVNTGINT